MLVDVRVYESDLPNTKGRFKKSIEYMEKNEIPYIIGNSYRSGKVIKSMMTFKQIEKMYEEVGPDILGAMVF